MKSLTISSEIDIMPDKDSRAITKYIICGRGKCNYNCEGNTVFRQRVAKYLKSYMNLTTRAMKSDLILHVSEELQNLGMTFMTINDDGITLKELSPVEARKKVAHRFRDAARTAKQLEAIPEVTKCLTTEPTTFQRQAYRRNLSLLLSSPCLQDEESTKLKQTLLLSDSLKKEESNHSTRSTQPRTMHFLSQTKDDFLTVRRSEVVCRSVKVADTHSQESLLQPTHTERKSDDPKILFSLSSHDCTERMTLQHEIFRKRKSIFSDLIELIDASPNTDYGEDFDDLSMLLTNCDDLFSIER